MQYIRYLTGCVIFDVISGTCSYDALDLPERISGVLILGTGFRGLNGTYGARFNARSV